MHFCQNFYIIFFPSHSCGCNACMHISNSGLLLEIFNFYYASRAPAIKIILFLEMLFKKFIKNKKK